VKRSIWFLSASLVLLTALAAACGQDQPIGGLDTPIHTIETMVPAHSTSIAGRAVSTLIRGAASTPDELATEIALPTCMPTPPAILPLPENFPNFPLPDGIKIAKVSTINNNPSTIQIVGYVPLSLRDSVIYLVDQLPGRGYKLGYGDSEANEAESQFTGNGWRGGFLVHAVYGCKEGSLWRVVLLKLE
jgi:hypothetical protein